MGNGSENGDRSGAGGERGREGGVEGGGGGGGGGGEGRGGGGGRGGRRCSDLEEVREGREEAGEQRPVGWRAGEDTHSRGAPSLLQAGRTAYTQNIIT